jgi:hypothetical protein
MQQNDSSSNGSPPPSRNGSRNWSEEQLRFHERRSHEIAQAMVDGLNRHAREKARQEAERALREAAGQPGAEAPT